MLIIISIAEIFFPLTAGKIKKAKVKAKPKWMALAGNPLNIPKLNQKGNGEAYQSWKNVQRIAIPKTIFKWMPDKFRVGEISSWILSFILLWMFWFIITKIPYSKKKGPKNIGPFLIKL